MIIRRCVICGKPFECYPSAKKVTCSMDCRRERQRRIVSAKPVQWSEGAKKKLSARGQTENLRRGTPAAQNSPIAGRFETNQEAKVWILVDPSGREIAVHNLQLWCRDNVGLFGKPPGDRSARQISAGFRAIAQTMVGHRGAPGKPRRASTYMGWSLKEPPKKP